MKQRITDLLFVLLSLLLFTSCRGELPYLRSEGELIDPSPGEPKHIKGMYLLNEGNMGSNKCTIDFYDYTTGEYFRNIYPEQNPDIVKELGDVCLLYTSPSPRDRG